MTRRLVVGFLAFLCAAFAQTFYPSTARTNLYFPHFTDGGSSASRWQTIFVFSNPSPDYIAVVQLFLYDNAGGPLAIDLGLGSQYPMRFDLPPNGSRILRSAASPREVSGWGVALANGPVQGTVLFRYVESGSPKVAVSSEATLPTPLYWSAANRWLGVAIANPSETLPIEVGLTAMDSGGTEIGSSSVSLGPGAHTAFNLMQLLPSLPGDFSGTIKLAAKESDRWFVAWTLNVDLDALNVVASLPPGAVGWPVSHPDRIREVYLRIYTEAHRFAKMAPWNVDLDNPPLRLVISPDKQINALARPATGTVQINLALAELISDSPSELASVVAHEIAHHFQYRYGGPAISTNNKEQDADMLGMLFCLGAGYDPYAGAGALAKFSMAYNQAGLVAQQFDDLTDAHTSFSTRIQAMSDLLYDLCSDPAWGSYCTGYKLLVHPHFPAIVPLGNKPPVR